MAIVAIPRSRNPQDVLRAYYDQRADLVKQLNELDYQIDLARASLSHRPEMQGVGQLLTVRQVAERLSVSPRLVHSWIERGELVPERPGGSRTLRIREADLRRLMDKGTGGR